VWGDLTSDSPSHRATLVIGGPEVGKTSLLRSCLHAWLLRDMPVMYVDLLDAGAIDWVEVLRRIARSVRDCSAPAPPALDELDGILRDLVADNRGRHEERCVDACTRTLAVLEEVGANRPVMLVFDQVEQIRIADLVNPIGEHLFRPVIGGRIPSVRLLLGVRPGTLQDAQLRQLLRGMNRVTLDLLSPDDAVHIMTEYGIRKGILDEPTYWPQWVKYVEVSRSVLDAPWPPSQLARFYAIYKAAVGA
jgi:hypothetical protein